MRYKLIFNSGHRIRVLFARSNTDFLTNALNAFEAVEAEILLAVEFQQSNSKLACPSFRSTVIKVSISPTAINQSVLIVENPTKPRRIIRTAHRGPQ